MLDIPLKRKFVLEIQSNEDQDQLSQQKKDELSQQKSSAAKCKQLNGSKNKRSAQHLKRKV